MTLETGDSGLSKLAIEADEVSVPSTMDLPIVYAKKKEISNDAKKQLVESLVEKDKGIYAFVDDISTSVRSSPVSGVEKYTPLAPSFGR